MQVQENNFVVKIMTIDWIPFKTIASEFKYYIRELQNQTLVTDNDVNISFFSMEKIYFSLNESSENVGWLCTFLDYIDLLEKKCFE